MSDEKDAAERLTEALKREFCLMVSAASAACLIAEARASDNGGYVTVVGIHMFSEQRRHTVLSARELLELAAPPPSNPAR